VPPRPGGATGPSRTACIGCSTSPSVTTNRAYEPGMAQKTRRSSGTSPSISCAPSATGEASGSGENAPAGTSTTSPQILGHLYRVNLDSEPCELPGGRVVPRRRARPHAVRPISRGAACPNEPPTEADQPQTRCTASCLTPIKPVGSLARARSDVQKHAAWCMIQANAAFVGTPSQLPLFALRNAFVATADRFACGFPNRLPLIWLLHARALRDFGHWPNPPANILLCSWS
jgi:hypothetical protein